MTTPSVSSVEANSTSPQARVQRVPVPYVVPGRCALCGRAEHPEGFADTSIDIEYHGVIYFCASCVGDIARCFGYISPTNFVALREQLEAQNSELNTLRQAVLGLESAVDSLTNYRDLYGKSDDTRRRGAVVPPLENTNEQPASTEDDSTESDSVSTGSVSGQSGNKPSAAAPDSQQGRNDVRDSASTESKFDLDELLQ